MALPFTKNKDNLTLDEILHCIPWTHSFKHSLSAESEHSEITTETPIYLTPGAVIDGRLNIGIYRNGALQFLPIGFLRRHGYQDQFFNYNPSSKQLENEVKCEKVVYLPLKLTTIEISFSRTQEGLFQVYGIRGTAHDFPLLIIDETERGLDYTGFYKGKEDTIGTFRNTNGIKDEKWSNYLRELREGRYQFTTITAEEAKKRIIVTKKSKRKTTLALPSHPAKSTADEEVDNVDWMQPKSIKRYLDAYVVGQERAKKTVAIAFSNYMAFVKTKDQSLPKSHLMLLGPTGSGKTYMVDLLAELADVPIAKAKLTGKSSEGYVGHRLSDVFKIIADQNKKDNQAGIIFLDELDKIARDGLMIDGFSGYGSRLQLEMIGWLEGDKVLLRYEDNGAGSGRKEKWINTENFLFVTAGAFHESEGGKSLAEIIAKRLNLNQTAIGFGRDHRDRTREDFSHLQLVQAEDLIEYGLKRELVGRIPYLGVLAELTTDEKVEILTSARNSIITGYTNLFAAKGYQLQLHDSVPRIIVEASPRETGARALPFACGRLFTEVLFDPDAYCTAEKVITINDEVARKLLSV